jgi:putative SOS response-associated peptidase YedK
MCGRSTRTNPVAIEGFTLTFNPYQLDRTLLKPAFNVAPSQPQLVLLRDATGVAARGMRWGLVPPGSATGRGPAPINARSESVAGHPFFRDAFRRRRCAIVADGFYEWQKTGKAKQPFFIRLKGGRAFGFAGLWEWNASVGESCTILTTEPNALVAPLHDRMPCILRDEAVTEWLDAATDRKRLMQQLAPLDAALMECWPVSTFVNAPANDDAACIAAVET